MNRRGGPWLRLWLPGVALACAAALVILEAPSAGRVVNAALAAVGVLLSWGVASAVRARYPDRPLSLLLFALAAVYAVQALVASPNPYGFTIARAARPAVEVFLIWLMLAFPSGRLRTGVDRWLVGVAAVSALALWLPALMLSPRIPLPGPFVMCELDCPRNVLLVSDRPELAQALVDLFRAVSVLGLLATAARLASRLRSASALMRRALAPVLLASMARLFSLALFLATDAGAWSLVLSFWAVPLSIAYGLLRGRLYIARALQQLVTGQRARPGKHALRELIARALGDPSLQIGYWVPEASRWIDADDRELVVPPPGDEKRAARMVAGERGEASAVLVHDAALLEEPSLVEAVASAMGLALTSHQLATALGTTRTEKAVAVESERRRIERDLHDGAQQRLIALRMKLGVAMRLLDADPGRAAALLRETGPDIDAALMELRNLAHGIAPPLLVEQGLGPALAEVARRFDRVIRLDVKPLGRLEPAVERAVYFCCVEALQNAAKHAGEGATLSLSLRRESRLLHFAVGDDGRGARPAALAGARGLDNMRQRMDELGGTLEIRALPQGGVWVEGTVPL